jgi:DNA-binding transcriptional MocR family regulator
MQVVYDYLLWKAPRGLGVLIPAKRTIATATGVGLATVKRAIAALVEWGLLLVERRWLRGKKPVRVGDEVRVINARMDTSNAYSFPPADEALVGGAQTDLVANALSTREAKNKALEKLRDRWGRWIPAASAAMVERLMAKWGIEESYEL